VFPAFLTTVLGLYYNIRHASIVSIMSGPVKINPRLLEGHVDYKVCTSNESQICIEVTSGTVDFISSSVLCGVAYFNHLLHLNELHSQEGWQVKHDREKIEFGLDGIDKNEMGQ
jgi:hypothetical protein